MGQLRQAEHRQARFLGRLQHGRVAAGQSRPQGASEHLGRIVPGNDVPGHAARFASDGTV